MKRGMKSKLFLLFAMMFIILVGCTSTNKKQEEISPRDVYTSIFLDDAYSFNRYINQGFPLDYKDKNGNTLIMNTLGNNSLNVLNVLLSKNIDLEARDKSGKTAIFYVRSIEALKTMVEAGADINATLNDGTPLLTFFIKEKSNNYSKFLIENGANLTKADNLGWTPLFWAVNTQNRELIQVLKKYGADFLTLDVWGNYPISYAYDEDIILDLLEISGYNIERKNLSLKNILGEVYLDCVDKGYKKAVLRLFELGVNPNYASYGDTAIDIATKNSDIDMIKFLKQHI